MPLLCFLVTSCPGDPGRRVVNRGLSISLSKCLTQKSPTNGETNELKKIDVSNSLGGSLHVRFSLLSFCYVCMVTRFHFHASLLNLDDGSAFYLYQCSWDG